MNEKHKEKWNAKELHGQFLRELPKETNRELTFGWLKSNIKKQTEAIIIAAQDHSLPTRSITSKFKNISPLCRLCNEKTETPMHILSACSYLAGSSYKERHDRVGRFIHYHLMKKSGFDVPEKYYEHQPQPSSENSGAKILWDFNIYTDNIISARRPDIVLIDKQTKKTIIIDINCPADKNITKNEKE